MTPVEFLITVYLLSIPLPFYYGLKLKTEGWSCLASDDVIREAEKLAKERGDYFFNHPEKMSRSSTISAFIPLLNTFCSLAVLGLIIIKDRKDV